MVFSYEILFTFYAIVDVEYELRHLQNLTSFYRKVTTFLTKTFGDQTWFMVFC